MNFHVVKMFSESKISSEVDVRREKFSMENPEENPDLSKVIASKN